MPRQPTGRPRGRPPGSGRGIGEDSPRLTVRLPHDLYARLEAFAEGYRYHRSDPPLAVCVREMMVFCLDHPDVFRQPRNVHQASRDHGGNYRQPENDNYRQPENVPRSHGGIGEHIRQPINVPVTPVDHGGEYRQPDNVTDFDQTKFYLAPLCKRGHDFLGSGKSLLRRVNQNCVQCQRELRQARDEARRMATVEG